MELNFDNATLPTIIGRLKKIVDIENKLFIKYQKKFVGIEQITETEVKYKVKLLDEMYFGTIAIKSITWDILSDVASYESIARNDYYNRLKKISTSKTYTNIKEDDTPLTTSEEKALKIVADNQIREQNEENKYDSLASMAYASTERYHELLKERKKEHHAKFLGNLFRIAMEDFGFSNLDITIQNIIFDQAIIMVNKNFKEETPDNIYEQLENIKPIVDRIMGQNNNSLYF